MRQRLWLTVFVIAGALLAVGQDNVNQDRRDLHQDHSDVRHDRRDVNHDRVDRNRGIRDIHHDRVDIARDRRDYATMKGPATGQAPQKNRPISLMIAGSYIKIIEIYMPIAATFITTGTTSITIVVMSATTAGTSTGRINQ